MQLFTDVLYFKKIFPKLSPFSPFQILQHVLIHDIITVFCVIIKWQLPLTFLEEHETTLGESPVIAGMSDWTNTEWLLRQWLLTAVNGWFVQWMASLFREKKQGRCSNYLLK